MPQFEAFFAADRFGGLDVPGGDVLDDAGP